MIRAGRTLLTLATLAPAGCTLPDRRAAEPVPAAVPPPAGRSQFAELIRQPGERVPLNEPVVAVVHREAALDVPRPAPTPPAPSLELPPPNPPRPAPDPPLVAALRHALDNRSDLAAEQLGKLDPANREAALALLPALVVTAREPLGPTHPRESGDLADHLQATADRLNQFAPLKLEKVQFVRGVDDFGRYDPLPDGVAFPPGAMAELYVEVRNAPCVPAMQPGDGDGYIAPLACRLQVRDRSGAVVPLTDRNRRSVEALADTRRDFTRSPIRDKYLRFVFPVPSSPGQYSVAVEVRDPASGRAVSRRVGLRVQ